MYICITCTPSPKLFQIDLLREADSWDFKQFPLHIDLTSTNNCKLEIMLILGSRGSTCTPSPKLFPRGFGVWCLLAALDGRRSR